ncbi:transglycosylase SLT domain-containing protein [Actinocrispum wychmicini]|uniref:Transglycosylase-like protein with SLT domain n=1 Tax=Actinocrispum wychmicini TaxID=1213861 RepID=A0A4R2JTA2_9PSEU|nr:transglycosylase SLT domain-containing protein [Actinocrispum wychmicini]TCO62357.1 transglycosylase-like protein with SLT domain [Actinocrispum wychmicini]
MGISGRAKLAIAGGSTAAVLVAAVVLLTGGDKQPPTKPAAALGDLSFSSAAVSTTPSVASSSAATTSSSASSSSSKATSSSRKPGAPAPKPAMPAPTSHPVDIPVPPPPHPPEVPNCTPTLAGDNAPKGDVKSALLAAAGKQYWTNASNPPLVAIDPPPDVPPPATPQLGGKAVITVPPALMQAIAWQESGWQSAIKACDGGLGTMQIMDPTAKWMNQRFGTSYDYKTLAGNTAIGAEYLQWLIAYFGENNFGYHYDITDPDLLTAVIVGYNAGPGAVVFANGHTVASKYANNVRALMSSQPWG